MYRFKEETCVAAKKFSSSSLSYPLYPLISLFYFSLSVSLSLSLCSLLSLFYLYLKAIFDVKLQSCANRLAAISWPIFFDLDCLNWSQTCSLIHVLTLGCHDTHILCKFMFIFYVIFSFFMVYGAQGGQHTNVCCSSSIKFSVTAHDSSRQVRM